MLETAIHTSNYLGEITDTSLTGGMPIGSSDTVTPPLLQNKLSGADLGFADGDLLLKVDRAKAIAGERLREFVSGAGFTDKLEIAFGNTLDRELALGASLQLANDDFGDSPHIQILSSETLGGASGAFAESTNTIYLSNEFIAQQDVETIASVILEEQGHFLDSRINTVDSAGDEGEIFAYLVQNKNFESGQLATLKVEDDSAWISINGVQVAIEQSRPADFGINLSSSHYSQSGNKFVSVNKTGGTYLSCTDFAFGRALEKGLIQNWTGLGGSINGHAERWDDEAAAWGRPTQRQARSDSFVVWDPNQGGAFSFGHVGFVERVNSDGSFVISEANFQVKMSFNSRTIRPGSNEFNTAKFIYLSSSPTPPPSGTSFQGVVDSAVNIRSGPGTNFSIVGSLGAGNARVFDTVARGTTHWDAREARNDDRWFRIQGTNQWVSSAFITGNPVFTGTVDTLLNVRTGPGTNFSIARQLNTGTSHAFDGVNVGTTVWDTKERINENRWFRLQGTNLWVSAANITGNPSY